MTPSTDWLSSNLYCLVIHCPIFEHNSKTNRRNITLKRHIYVYQTQDIHSTRIAHPLSPGAGGEVLKAADTFLTLNQNLKINNGWKKHFKRLSNFIVKPNRELTSIEHFFTKLAKKAEGSHPSKLKESQNLKHSNFDWQLKKLKWTSSLIYQIQTPHTERYNNKIRSSEFIYIYMSNNKKVKSTFAFHLRAS